MNRAVPLLTAAVLLALGACGQPAPKGPESDVVPLPKAEPAPAASSATPPAAAKAAPVRPAGPAEPAPLVTDALFVNAASVSQVAWLPDVDAKVYSVVGGDPAINGLYTQIAFPPEGPDGDWTVFRVGDFESWQVIEQGPGRVVLQVRVSRIDPSSGNPVTEDKKLIVAWTGGPEQPPAAVTVTPGQ